MDFSIGTLRPEGYVQIALARRAAEYAKTAQAGNVASHANTIRPRMRQRTSDQRRAAPTPTMALVIVWVVDSGIP
jgi:hypothetical protein